MRLFLFLVVAFSLLLALPGCTREERASEEFSASESQGEAHSAPEERGEAALREETPSADDPSTNDTGQAPQPGVGSGQPAERVPTEQREPITPVELPLELLGDLPEEPIRARDARIGELERSLLAGDPQARRATAGATAFLEAAIAGEASRESFFDAITAESLLDRLEAECDEVRVGLGERLPQGEWAVPFRCLLGGDPVPLKGTLYLDLNGEAEVVDGSLEYLERFDQFNPESARQESTPF